MPITVVLCTEMYIKTKYWTRVMKKYYIIFEVILQFHIYYDHTSYTKYITREQYIVQSFKSIHLFTYLRSVNFLRDILV